MARFRRSTRTCSSSILPGSCSAPTHQLNVSGSAYFSTAQQLRLSDGGIFTANTGLLAFDSTLSVGSPVSFGFFGQGPYGSIVLSSPSTVLQTGAVLGLMGGGIQINGSKISAQRVMLGSTSSAGEMSVQPFVGNPFSGASGNGQVQALPGTLIVAGGGGVIPASIDVTPNVSVPTGAQVNTTTNPIQSTCDANPGRGCESWRASASSYSECGKCEYG
jgi:hypothetical protein